MDNKERNAIKKIDKTLQKGSFEGITLTDDLREMLTRTKDLLNKGMKLDPLVSLIEAVDKHLKQEGIA